MDVVVVIRVIVTMVLRGDLEEAEVKAKVVVVAEA